MDDLGKVSLSAELWKHASPKFKTLVVVAGAMIAVVSGVALVTAFRFRLSMPDWLDGSDGLDQWASFASVAGFVTQTALALATLLLAWVLSGIFADLTNRRQRLAQQRAETVRLSEKLVDTQFYIQVMYPAWEVALKWMNPPDERFRSEVVGAEFRLPKRYIRRMDNTDWAENNPRSHPHFVPYDREAGGATAAISQLSESTAFATWVRFWRNVKFLIDNDLVDKDATVELMREWYLWWAPFMTQYLHVCREVREMLKERYADYRPDESCWQESSTEKILALHNDFRISPYCGWESEDAFQTEVRDIARGIYNNFSQEIDKPGEKNTHVDGPIDEARWKAVLEKRTADQQARLAKQRAASSSQVTL